MEKEARSKLGKRVVSQLRPLFFPDQTALPLLRPRTLLTISVALEAKNSTATDVHAFQMNWLSGGKVAQIIVNERTVPAMMQMMQIIQQILFKTLKWLCADLVE